MIKHYCFCIIEFIKLVAKTTQYFSRKLLKGIWRTPGILPVTEIVNHMFIFFAFHNITCHSLHLHIFCSIKDIHLKFTNK